MPEHTESIFRKMIDNMYFLLAIGLLFPTVFYFGWGLVELFVFNNFKLSDFMQRR